MPEVRRRRSRGLSRHVRRLKRWSRQSPRRAAALGAGGVLLLCGLWAVWTLWAATADLRETADRADVMRAALLRADADGAREAMREFQAAAESAEDRTSGPTWSVFEAVPLLGDDAEGVALVATVLADLGREGLPPIADAADAVSAEAFQPTDRVFPVKRISAMSTPAQQSEAAFEKAAGRLADVDSSRFFGPVQQQFDTLRTLVGSARSTLGSTYRASRLMPRMLGADEPRYFLLVLQNNAEMRSSGGLPGALSLVRAQEGRVEIVEQTDMSDIGEATADLELRLSAEERRLFGDNIGGIAVNATQTPDFPRAAALIRARWERAMGGRLDGMFFVDPVAVAYLLQGTGQVPVPGYAPVNHLNVVAAVENDIYRLTPDRDQQSDYQQAVAEAVFNAFADGRGDTVQAIRGLATSVDEGRIRMHFFDGQDQAEVAGTQIAGEFVAAAGPEPHVGIYINDAGPTKMQYYLRYDATLFARSCSDDDAQELMGSIEFVNDTPPGELPASVTGAELSYSRVEAGEQLLVVYLTAPVGGTVEELAIEGQRVPQPAVQPYAGREVATLGIRLDRQERQTVDFTLRSGPDQPGDAELEVTPGAFTGTPNREAGSACTVR